MILGVRLVVTLFALFSLAACSTTNKTRLDCHDDCKKKGVTWSGIISRSERVDDQGEVEIKEVCRCNIEESY